MNTDVAYDADQLRELAERYTEAWCSGDPERVAGLILCDTFPTFVTTDDTPTMPAPQQWQQIEEALFGFFSIIGG